MACAWRVACARAPVRAFCCCWILAVATGCSFDARLQGDASITNAELATARLQQALSADMLKRYGLVLYVDKANQGPLAQHMVVFRADAGGRSVSPLYVWPVSTGREEVEPDANGARESTATPEGLFTLDPHRMFASHVSSEWNEPMPYAMFLSGPANAQGGLAIHAAVNDGIERLGSRASAGCVRLSPEHARTLFELVRTRYAQTATARDMRYRPNSAKGYSVLVLIEDYPRQETMASIGGPQRGARRSQGD